MSLVVVEGRGPDQRGDTRQGLRRMDHNAGVLRKMLGSDVPLIVAHRSIIRITTSIIASIIIHIDIP